MGGECWLLEVPGGVLERLVRYLSVEELDRMGKVGGWTKEGERGLLSGLRLRWRALERLEEEEVSAVLEELMVSEVKTRDDEFRWEDLVELRDKCHDGLDVLEEHAEDEGIPWPTRWELELGLMGKVEEGLRLIAHLSTPTVWADRDEEKRAGEERRLRFTISLLDSHYGTAHLAFLTAFLQANPEPNTRTRSVDY